MMPIQILGALFLVGALVHVALRWRSRSLGAGQLIFWALVFGGILLVLLVPQASVRVAHLLGVRRGTDIVVYGSMALLFYLVYGLYVRLENLQRRMTRMLRELAIKETPGLILDNDADVQAKGTGDVSSSV
jgi:hypothetical protein